MAPSNRRKHQRVQPTQLTARIRTAMGLHIGLGVENISLGGAFVKCKSVLPVSTRVSLELARAGAQPIVISAQVTTCIAAAEAARSGRAAGVGLTFLSLAPHVEAWLTNLIKTLTPRPPPRTPPVLQPVHRPVDVEVTQPGLPALGTSEEALKKEVQTLRARLQKYEGLLEQLTTENRKLKALLKNLR